MFVCGLILPVGVQDGPGAEWVEQALSGAAEIRFERVAPEDARLLLRNGKVALVVIPGEALTYWYDSSRPLGQLARLTVNDVLQRAAGRSDVRDVSLRMMTDKLRRTCHSL